MSTLYTDAGFVSLSNDTPTAVAAVTVPAGSYLIQAEVQIVNNDLGNDKAAKCTLSTSPFPRTATLAWGTGADLYKHQFSFLDAETFAGNTTITLDCGTHNGEAEGILTATKVTSIVIAP